MYHHIDTENEDDDISILTCIEQDYDLDVTYNTTENQIQYTCSCPTTITGKYAKMKHANIFVLESTNDHIQQDNDLFNECMTEDPVSIINQDHHTQEDILHDCEQGIFQDFIDKPVNSKDFHLSIDYKPLGNQERGS